MRHAAHVAHHSRGRLRIRVPAAKGNPAALEKIRESLAKVSGVKGVEVSESIGSVTIHYDPRQHANFEEHLASEGSQEVVSVCREPSVGDLEDVPAMIEHEAEFLAEHSHAAKVLFDWANGLDRTIKRMTGNAVDLKVIAPAALAVGAFMELGVTASTPVWLTLGLFSFNHFVDLHSHPITTDQEATAQNVPPRPTRKRRFP
jgi:hypothetical protein